MTTIWNMVRQYREFQSRLNDAERLRLYAQSAVSKHQALNASLAKAESKVKYRRQEAKDGARRLRGRKKRGTMPNRRLRWLV